MSLHLRYLYFAVVVGAAWANDTEKYGEGSADAGRACRVGQVKVLPWISRMRVGGVRLQLHPLKCLIVEKLLTIAAGREGL
jgi:hypothetical protein